MKLNKKIFALGACLLILCGTISTASAYVYVYGTICDIAGRTRQSVRRGGRVQQRKTMVSEVAGRMGKESTKNERDTLSIFAEEILI